MLRNRLAQPEVEAEFAPAFEQSLARCDGELAQFSVERVRDELIGDLAQRLELGYDELALELGEPELRRSLVSQLLAPEVPLPPPESAKLPAGVTLPPSPAQAATPNAEHLRTRIGELAQALIKTCAPTIEVLAQHDGLGFACRCSDPASLSAQETAVLGLLQALAGPTTGPLANINPLLCGTPRAAPWLDDEALTQLFRLIKLARQLPHAGEPR